jgi:hypothetical protein
LASNLFIFSNFDAKHSENRRLALKIREWALEARFAIVQRVIIC